MPADSAARYSFCTASAHSSSAGVGLNTSLAMGTWLGWMHHFPSKPSALADWHSRRQRTQAGGQLVPDLPVAQLGEQAPG